MLATAQHGAAELVNFTAGHVIPRLEGEKLQVMRQFLETQQMVAQVKHESSKL